MIRTMQETKGGLGELTLHLEEEDEIRELERVCPRKPIPGVLQGYEWKGDKLVLFTRLDENYKPEPVALTKPADSSVVEPVPTPAKLNDWSIADLITKAAELNVVHKPGERKAELIARILPAWHKRYQELTKPLIDPNASKA